MTALLGKIEPHKNAPALRKQPGADHGGIDSMAPQGYKCCKICGETKPLDGFHRARASRDGHTCYCKECNCARVREWNRNNPAKASETGRRWREENAEQAAAASRRWQEEHPDVRREIIQRHRERHPEKYRARNALNNAVRDGRLLKPESCEECGEEAESRLLHGHHEDYSKPLEVDWLCDPCHKRRHNAVSD